MQNRQEIIHNKGFSLNNNRTSYEGPTLYKKTKIGTKTVEDAVLNLGTNQKIDKKYGDKTVIYNALANNNYKIAFEMEENWYRQDDKLLGNKEFLVQDPDGYLLRFSEDLGQKQI